MIDPMVNPMLQIHSPLVNDSVRIFVQALPDFGQFPLVFYVQFGAQVTLMVKQRQVPPLSWLTRALGWQIRSAGIEGLWLHINPAAGKNVFAKNHCQLLQGVPRSIDDNGFVYGPARIAYLSCSAGTLQRDLDFFEACGYRVCRIIPYDFFPWTAHVECLALIECSVV